MKYSNKQQSGGYGGCLLWILIILGIWLMSCTKQTIGENKYTFAKYEMVVDWLTLDTAKVLKRTIWDLGEMQTPNPIDTTKEMWYIDCNMLDVLQHLYYRKNGKKIQP